MSIAKTLMDESNTLKELKAASEKIGSIVRREASVKIFFPSKENYFEYVFEDDSYLIINIPAGIASIGNEEKYFSKNTKTLNFTESTNIFRDSLNELS